MNAREIDIHLRYMYLVCPEMRKRSQCDQKKEKSNMNWDYRQAGPDYEGLFLATRKRSGLYPKFHRR
jgi:hypothetical protein